MSDQSWLQILQNLYRQGMQKSGGPPPPPSPPPPPLEPEVPPPQSETPPEVEEGPPVITEPESELEAPEQPVPSVDWVSEFPPWYLIYEPTCYTLGCLWRGGTLPDAATSSNRSIQAHALSADINRVVNLYANQIFDNLRRTLPAGSNATAHEQPLRKTVIANAIRGIQRTINAMVEAHYLTQIVHAPPPSQVPYSHSPGVAKEWNACHAIPEVDLDRVNAWVQARGVRLLPPILLRAWLVAKGACRGCCSETHARWNLDELRYVTCPPEWNPYGAHDPIRSRFPLIDRDSGTLAGDLLSHNLTLAWFHTPYQTSIFQSASMRSAMSVEMLSAILATTVHVAARAYNDAVVVRMEVFSAQERITRAMLVAAANTSAVVGFSGRQRTRRTGIPARAPPPGGAGAVPLPAGGGRHHAVYQCDSDVADEEVEAVLRRLAEMHTSATEFTPVVTIKTPVEHTTKDAVRFAVHFLEAEPFRESPKHKKFKAANTAPVIQDVLHGPAPTLGEYSF